MSDGSVVTCTACREQLVGSDARRLHYRSDLHRVNLKRKVGGLGPLTAEEFSRRVQVVEVERATSGRGREASFCAPCSKKFSSARALANHEKSRRHQDRVRTLANGGVEAEASSVGGTGSWVGSDVDTIDEDAVEAELGRRLAAGAGLSAVECVFDGRGLADASANLQYMASQFGFFVPFEERLADADGLLTYLGQKVGVGYACVQCDRGFGGVAAVQKHMRDKRHCGMATEWEEWVEEYGEFYDLDGMEGADGVGAADDGWEEVEDGDVEAAALVVADGEMEAGEADEAGEVGAEAVGLAVGGKVVGHRSLARYYRQGAGRAADARVAVAANREVAAARRAAFASKRVGREVAGEQRAAARRQRRFELLVGGQNYYTRKARFKQSMAVFNSGYRA